MTTATPTVTLEAAQDFKALISHMDDDQVQTMLVNTIVANKAQRMEVTKHIALVNGVSTESFTIQFLS